MPNETINTPILTLDSDAKLETAQSIQTLPGMNPECLPYPPDLNRNAWRYRENRKRQPHCRGLLQGFPYCHPG